jgi:hypothetical protein
VARFLKYSDFGRWEKKKENGTSSDDKKRKPEKRQTAESLKSQKRDGK